MKYSEFRHKTKPFPLFRSDIFPHLTDQPNLLRNQMVRWIKKGLVLQLKRGLYTLNTDDRQAGLSKFFLANQLYMPSYISLETALNYYELIPEGVPNMTSITTKKTQSFSNAFGLFIYRHVKLSAFDYFTTKQDEDGHSFNIATPEKAIVDFLYFKFMAIQKFETDIFESSFRFQNLDLLDTKRLRTAAKLFNNQKLERAVESFILYKEQSTC